MKRLGIAGSTGGMGQHNLRVIKDLKKNGYDIEVSWLGCYSNIEEMEKQIKNYSPGAVSVFDSEKAEKLSRKVDVPVYSGKKGLMDLIKSDSYEGFVNTLYGTSGIEPTAEAIKKGKTIYLANKETLVSAGPIIMDMARKHIPDYEDPSGVKIRMEDDEPAAQHRCLRPYKKEEIPQVLDALITTCSGGALKNMTREEIENATLDKALNHPTFKMRPQITTNSATLMNKAHEVIQGAYYFDVPLEKCEVLVHPGSYISSGVRTIDGANTLEVCPSDTSYHIHYALTYPETVRFNFKDKKTKGVKLLEMDDDLIMGGEPDTKRFPCFKYGIDSLKIGGSMPAAINAANEVVVGRFIDRDDETVKYIKDIEDAIKYTLDNHNPIKNPDLDEILEVDKKIKSRTQKYLDERYESPE